MKTTTKKNKTRLIVKNGHENIVLPVAEVVLFYIEGRSVMVIGHDSKKYHFHKTLTEIEEELDNTIFFRANRRTLVNINFIKGFTACECNKLKVKMNIHIQETEIVISQETAPLFKTWICES